MSEGNLSTLLETSNNRQGPQTASNLLKTQLSSKSSSSLSKMEASSSSSSSSEGIQIICAGLGRTGTMSLTEALNKLGYKTYHYLDFTHQYAWAELADGKRTPQEIVQLIAKDGYNATLENPTVRKEVADVLCYFSL